MENKIAIKIVADTAAAKRGIASITEELRKIEPAAAGAAQDIEELGSRLERLKAASKLDAARDILGVRSLRSGQREIQRVQAAFARLRDSGKASAQELGAAWIAMQARIAELQGRISGIPAAIQAVQGSIVRLVAGTAAFGLAAREAVVFEDALVDLQRAANLSRDDAAAMGEELQDLAQSLGMASTAVVGLATSAAKTGVAKDELLAFTRVVAQAAMAWDMMPEEAGQAMAKLKNVLGLGVQDMEAFAGAINELADNAAASEREIVEALKLGGASGRQFGLTAKETAALATTFISLGASAEQAGTAMRTMLGRLRLATSGAGGAGKALRSVVGDTKAFARAMATDAKAALMQFLSALSQMTAPERMRVLRDIFQEGLDTENIAKLASDADKLAEALRHAGKSDEELVRSLRDLTSLKLGTTQAEINRLGAAWRNAGEAVGRLFLPFIRAAAVALSAVAQAIDALATTFPALSRLVAFGALLAAAWRPLQMLWGLILVVGGRLKGVLQMVSGAASALATAVRMGTLSFAALRTAMGGLLGPIGLVVTGLSLLWDAWHLLSSDSDDPLAAKRQALSEVSGALRGVGEAAKAAKTQIQASMEEAAAPIDALKADYKAATDSIIADLARRQQAIELQSSLQQAIIEASSLSQRDAIAALAEETRRAEQAKVDAVAQAGRQMEETWQRTYGQAIEIARAAGMDTTALEAEALQAKMAIYQQQEAAYRATVDRLIAEERRFTEAAKRAEEDRALLRMSVQDRIRALQQRTMSEAEAYADRVRQIEEKLAQADMARAAGNFDQARRLAEDAMRLAESNARAVTQTVEQGGRTVTQTIISEAQAAQTAMGQIARAGQIADQAIGAFGQTMQQQAAAAAQALQEPMSRLQQIRQAIEGLAGQQAQAIAVKLDADDAAAKASIERLKQLAAAQKVVVQLEADTKAAQEAIAELRSDPENQQLQMQARIATDRVQDDIPAVQQALEAAGLQIPAELDGEKLAASIEQMRAQVEQPTQSEHTILDNAKEVLDRILSLDGKDTSSTHTIYVREVQRRAMGGLVQRLAAGGQAWRRIVGRVSGPGTSTSDSIPAMLSAGEYVVRAAAVRKYGVGLLEALNRGRLELHSHQTIQQGPQREIRLTIQGPRGQAARVSTTRDEARRLVRLLTAAGVSVA